MMRSGLEGRPTTPLTVQRVESVCPVSSFLLGFGLVGFEGWWFEVGFEGPAPVEVFVGPDAVVFVEVAGDVSAEVDAISDVVAVEALVFERLEPALDDAVDVLRAAPGAHVREVRPGGEPVDGRCRSHRRSVAGLQGQGHRIAPRSSRR